MLINEAVGLIERAFISLITTEGKDVPLNLAGAPHL
mgnify:CR=1 FL=1